MSSVDIFVLYFSRFLSAGHTLRHVIFFLLSFLSFFVFRGSFFFPFFSAPTLIFDKRWPLPLLPPFAERPFFIGRQQVLFFFIVGSWIAKKKNQTPQKCGASKVWESLGLAWFLFDFSRFYRFLLGFTEFYWVLPGFTGFYWVLLGLTEID